MYLQRKMTDPIWEFWVPLQNPRQYITIECTQEANHETHELGKFCKVFSERTLASSIPT